MDSFVIENFNSKRLKDFSVSLPHSKITLIVAPTYFDRDLADLLSLINRESNERMLHALGSGKYLSPVVEAEASSDSSVQSFSGFLPVVNPVLAVEVLWRVTIAELFGFDALLSLLFLKCATPYCPDCNSVVGSEGVAQASIDLSKLKPRSKEKGVYLLATSLDEFSSEDSSQAFVKVKRAISFYSQAGYQRFILNEVLLRIDAPDFEDTLRSAMQSRSNNVVELLIVVDSVGGDSISETRLAEALEMASNFGAGAIKIFETAPGRSNLEPIKTVSKGLYCQSCNLSFAPVGLELVHAEAMSVLHEPSTRRARKSNLSKEKRSWRQTLGSLDKVKFANIRVAEKSLKDLFAMNAEELILFFSELEQDLVIDLASGSAKETIKQICERLRAVSGVGFSFVQLKSSLADVSFGTRIKAFLLGYSLRSPSGSLVVIENPSEQFHPKDLTDVLRIAKSLSNNANAVLLTERDEKLKDFADYVVSLQNDGLQGAQSEALVSRRLCVKDTEKKLFLEIDFVADDLKRQHLAIPLNSVVALVGVAGSGKTRLMRALSTPNETTSDSFKVKGENNIKQIRYEGNHSEALAAAKDMGFKRLHVCRQSWQNLAQELGALDRIAAVFASQSAAKRHGLSKEHFNKRDAAGYCDDCNGLGGHLLEVEGNRTSIDSCQRCFGTGYSFEVLNVDYRTMSIADVLKTPFSDLRDVFAGEKALFSLLEILIKFGLGESSFITKLCSVTHFQFSRLMLAKVFSDSEPKQKLYLLEHPFIANAANDFALHASMLEQLIMKGGSFVFSTHDPLAIKLATWVVEFSDRQHVLFSGPAEQFLPDWS